MIKEKQKKLNILIVDEVHTLYLWGLSREEDKAFRRDFAKLDLVAGQLLVRLPLRPYIIYSTSTHPERELSIDIFPVRER